ncbi:hypothetical protein CY34DRAFT_810821 [Suillus luteus UH-Slu-Lm8-n1]|uniref:Uncharacterized protein n=1 Tax=Suillus luteus UH-Slu-Lm8-n1 TaxID=930992 RepID=A0A0D0A602_9AGAM|nr:hypothetical protein CY34DRAFT_810821 [Suillus luteus UH-Slu-Lm8-n1]
MIVVPYRVLVNPDSECLHLSAVANVIDAVVHGKSGDSQFHKDSEFPRQVPAHLLFPRT